ncbi:hypothetical protein AB5J72_50550 [Streptomyces sp. CG1]
MSRGAHRAPARRGLVADPVILGLVVLVIAGFLVVTLVLAAR